MCYGSVTSGGNPIPNTHLHLLTYPEVTKLKEKVLTFVHQGDSDNLMVKGAPINASLHKGKMDSGNLAIEAWLAEFRST